MPQGRRVRQDDETRESLKIRAEKKLSRSMLNAMTGEEGPLQAGALPSVKAQSVAAQQHLHQALDDDGRKVAKPPPKKPRLMQSRWSPRLFFSGGPRGWVHPTMQLCLESDDTNNQARCM